MENNKVYSTYEDGTVYELKGVRNRGGRLNTETGLKLCGRCKEEKTAINFAGRRASADGLQPYCKSCNNNANKGQQPPDRPKEQVAWGNKVGSWKAKHDSVIGLCEICQSQSATLQDHDHATKSQRGFLCRSCNGRLGLLDALPNLSPEELSALSTHKDVKWFSKALEYYRYYRLKSDLKVN